jgi:hypothetical protein
LSYTIQPFWLNNRCYHFHINTPYNKNKKGPLPLKKDSGPLYQCSSTLN